MYAVSLNEACTGAFTRRTSVRWLVGWLVVGCSQNSLTRAELDHLWCFPPPEMMERLVAYATEHGRLTRRPYFSLDGRRKLTGDAWGALRSKWHHEHGVTNVWREPALRGVECLKKAGGKNKCVHTNQSDFPAREPTACCRRVSCGGSLAETINGLYKTEVIHRRRGGWKGIDDVSFSTLEWVDWFNHRRLLEPIGDVPPAEFEAAYYAKEGTEQTDGLRDPSLRITRLDSPARCSQWARSPDP